MSSDGVAIRLRNVSKHYPLFDRPEDRLKQFIIPRLQRLAGSTPKRYYREFAALQNVSFEIRRGETVGIVGRNGSGKSTLLQIVCGTLRPTQGTVEIQGRVAALLELGSGFNPEFTGRENVYLSGAILGFSRTEIDRRFDDIARFADIGEFVEQPVKTYSSGMYLRLAFATAINVNPDILVIDEALAVGDEAFQRKCFARIEQIQTHGGTILFVSHAPQTITQLCSRAMLFDEGEMLLEGRPKSVLGQYQRLVHAPIDAAAEIRSKIRDTRSVQAPMDDSSTQSVTRAEANTEKHSPEQFNASLLPKSTVTLGVGGASIHDACLRTTAGDPVNILKLGHSYVYEYFVDFFKDAEDVGFGVQIRTVEGLALCGAHTSLTPATRIKRVTCGTKIRVQFDFSCILLPGTYFCSCGVVGTLGGDQALLHRLIDAVMFMVGPEPDLIAMGKFDTNIIPRIEILS